MSGHAKLLKGFAIASFFAVVTPAAGAGLVAAAASGTMVVADAASVPALRNSTYEGAGETSVGGPLRLSALAGDDAEAWSDARSVGHIARPGKLRKKVQ
jgi:hypothetical protein